jgi:hypothetical protein
VSGDVYALFERLAPGGVRNARVLMGRCYGFVTLKVRACCDVDTNLTEFSVFA